MTGTDPRRLLPSVNALLELDAVRSLGGATPAALLTAAARDAIEAVRDGRAAVPAEATEWGRRVRAALRGREQGTLRRVHNATGIVLHTNLGRAPLAPEAVAAVEGVARDPVTLEYDLERGARGGRDAHCAGALRQLTGADDALVVNNCAAALALALRALARAGGGVVVSRGELVEIGGSFRVPEIMALSGCTLIEVGTTNRTHLHDYRRALDAGASAIARIHRSNFRLEGYVHDVPDGALAALAGEYGVPLVHDLGSGLLLPLDRLGLGGEPTARDAVANGADVVVMSGDKLLGGPQAGIAVGRSGAVAAMRRDPFARAARADKLTLAALQATLELYATPGTALARVPVLALLAAPVEHLRERAAALLDRVRHGQVAADAVDCDGEVGAGAFAARRIPSAGIAPRGDAAALDAALRAGDVPVITRARHGRVIVNLRSVPERDDDALGDAIVAALA